MAEIKRSGPYKVLISPEGEAVSSRRAREEHGVKPDIIFIRNDGWTLGAPRCLETQAYKLWESEWSGFVRLPDTTAMSISEYHTTSTQREKRTNQ